MMTEYNRMLDEADKKRAEEKAKRDEKIKNLMDRMGDVIRKTDEAEKEQDKRLLAQQLQKDKEAERLEQKKRDDIAKKNQECTKLLGKQIED